MRSRRHLPWTLAAGLLAGGLAVRFLLLDTAAPARAQGGPARYIVVFEPTVSAAEAAALYSASYPSASPSDVKSALRASDDGMTCSSGGSSRWGCLGGDPDGSYESLVCAKPF